MVGTIAIMVVMGYLLIPPGRQSQRDQAVSEQPKLERLKPGDKTYPNSGIIGIVVSVKDKSIAIRSADTKLEILRSSRIGNHGNAPAENGEAKASASSNQNHLSGNSSWSSLASLVWSAFEIIFPPQSRKPGGPNSRPPVRVEHRKDARRSRTLVARLDQLKQEHPERTPFTIITEATGTNDLSRYFQFYDRQERAEPDAGDFEQFADGRGGEDTSSGLDSAGAARRSSCGHGGRIP